MPRPTSASQIPAAARPIIEAAHQRFRAACRRGVRPCITDPRTAGALLTAPECVALAACGYFPIPPEVIRLGMTPAEHQQQQILETVAQQLPEGVATVLEMLEV